MTSPLLALFTRSVRADTRAKSTYWARAGLAAFMLAVMVATAIANQGRGAPGLAFFETIIFVQAAFITLAGVGYFASVITEEKEEEMLGLLRMTKLNPLSILLGKSTGRMVGALLLLTAQVPFTQFAVTLGGISMAQVVATYCTLGAYLFLLGNLALLASVLASRTAQAAVITAAALALGSLAGSLLKGAALALEKLVGPEAVAVATLGSSAEALNGMTPFFRLSAILSTGFHDAPCGVQVWSNLAAGIACFLAAWLIFERRSESPATASRPLTHRLRRKGFAPGRVPAFRAIEWKDFHFLHGGRFVFRLKIIAYLVLAVAAVWLANPWFFGRAWFEQSMTLTALFAIALALELGWTVSRIFNAEIHGQTLPALTLLPLSLRNLFGAKISGSFRAVEPVGYCFLLSAAVATFGFAWNEMKGVPLLLGTLLIGFLYVVFFVLAHVVLFAQVTVYLSLRVKRGSFLLAIAIWCGLAALATAAQVAAGFFLLIVSPVICVTLGAVFQAKILQRLEDLAAEG